MNELARWRLRCCMALACIVLALQSGCAENAAAPDGADGAKLTWDSPKMHDIEKEWRALQDVYSKTPEKIPGDDGKSKYVQLEKMIDALLRSRLSEQELRQLAVSCDALPIRVEDSGFTEDALTFLIKSLVDLNDRASLVTLLAARCPNRVRWPANIEFYLAYHGKRLTDPVLVLGEAYAKCEVPETRHNLAAAVRRGFAGFGIHGKDDADYLKNAVQWYKKEKDHLYANEDYMSNEFAGTFTVERYEKAPELYNNPGGFRRHPLFEKKH